MGGSGREDGFDNKPQEYFLINILTIMITVTTKFSLKSL